MRAPKFNIKSTLLSVALLGSCWVCLPGVAEPLYRDYGADLQRDVPAGSEAQLEYIKKHLDQPFDGYARYQVLTPEFAVIALSHMASGMMNRARTQPERRTELAPYTLKIVLRALSAEVSPYSKSPAKVKDLGRRGLYLSHLNLILGVHRYVSGSGEYDALHERITRHLRRRSLADDDFHAQSYPGSTRYQWPADQSVTLASLYLYDKIHDTHLSREPIRGWLAYMKRHRDPVHGLPFSALPGAFSYSKMPRGCALSWSILYMAQFAPEEAARVYQAYRNTYQGDVLGWGGFREWPPGIERGMDVDSGPILFGLGLAATGLGVGPARIFGDERAYTHIMRATSNMGFPSQSILGGRRYRLAPLVGEAMLFNGTTARVWFEEPPADTIGDDAEFPVGSVALALAFLLWGGWCVRGIVRETSGSKARSDSSLK